MGQLDVKMVIRMRHGVKKYFSTAKSHSLIEAQDQKTSLAQKKLVHTAILLFRFEVKTLSEQIVLPENLKKTNTLGFLRRKKTKRRPIIASAIASQLLKIQFAELKKIANNRTILR